MTGEHTIANKCVCKSNDDNTGINIYKFTIVLD